MGWIITLILARVNYPKEEREVNNETVAGEIGKQLKGEIKQTKVLGRGIGEKYLLIYLRREGIRAECEAAVKLTRSGAGAGYLPSVLIPRAIAEQKSKVIAKGWAEDSQGNILWVSKKGHVNIACPESSRPHRAS
jgi:hypothetical protein